MRLHHITVLSLVALLTPTAGCGSSSPGGDGDGDGEPDASTDAAQASCADLRAPKSLGELSPISEGLQIHPALGFDGETIWIAYTGNDIENMSVFDTFVLRLNCGGAVIGDATRLTTTSGRSEIDPAIAVGSGSVLVTWTSDDPGAANNLDIVMRAIDLDGSPRGATDVTLEAVTSGGQAVVGNAFYSAVAPTSDGFIVAGSVAFPGGTTFRAFAQPVDPDAETVGPILALAAPGGDTHSEVAAVVDPDGTAWISYTEAQPGGDRALLASVDGGVVTEQSTPFALSSTPALAARGSVRITAASADTGGQRDISIEATDGTRSALDSIGALGALDHTPALALASETSGALAYYRNLGGFRNQLVVVGFEIDLSASTLTFAAPIEIAHETPAPPYAPAIAAIGDGHYIVVWAEGTSPEFTLRGEILSL